LARRRKRPGETKFTEGDVIGLLKRFASMVALMTQAQMQLETPMLRSSVSLSRPAKDGFGWFVSNLKGTHF
jgi:hypothetical protein